MVKLDIVSYETDVNISKYISERKKTETSYAFILDGVRYRGDIKKIEKTDNYIIIITKNGKTLEFPRNQTIFCELVIQK